VLRDEDGRHLSHLTSEEEIGFYSHLADRGEVIRSQVMKKGRVTQVFRLKTAKRAEKPVDPSLSAPSECSLTDEDSKAMAGCAEYRSSRQIERWIGWGLITRRSGG
jgi:hypothetical protein